MSVGHYQFLATSKHEGVPESGVEVCPQPQPEIFAWGRDDLDGAFVRDQARTKLRKTGMVLPILCELAERSVSTFGAWAATDEFIAQRSKGRPCAPPRGGRRRLQHPLWCQHPPVRERTALKPTG